MSLFHYGAKLSPFTLGCQNVLFYTVVPNCPGSKLSSFKLWCQIVLGAKLSSFTLRCQIVPPTWAVPKNLCLKCLKYLKYDISVFFFSLALYVKLVVSIGCISEHLCCFQKDGEYSHPKLFSWVLKRILCQNPFDKKILKNIFGYCG